MTKESMELARALKETEARVMEAIRKRMEELAQDGVLRQEMEKEIREELGMTHTSGYPKAKKKKKR